MRNYSDEHVMACAVPPRTDLEAPNYHVLCIECGKPVRHMNAEGGTAWVGSTKVEGELVHFLYCNSPNCSKHIWECCSGDQVRGQNCVTCGRSSSPRQVIVVMTIPETEPFECESDVATWLACEGMEDVTVFDAHQTDILEDVEICAKLLVEKNR